MVVCPLYKHDNVSQISTTHICSLYDGCVWDPSTRKVETRGSPVLDGQLILLN